MGPELQIRRVNRDNSETVFFVFLNESIPCDPSLKPSQPGGFNEGPQCMFCTKIRKLIPKLLVWQGCVCCYFWKLPRSYDLCIWRSGDQRGTD